MQIFELQKSAILAQAACVRHACLRAPCVAWPLLLPSVIKYIKILETRNIKRKFISTTSLVVLSNLIESTAIDIFSSWPDWQIHKAGNVQRFLNKGELQSVPGYEYQTRS